MREDDPLYIRILDKLGVNTTRLRWKLYEKEKKIKEIAKHGIKPARFQWLSYGNKLCLKCRAVNNHDAKICTSCDAKLPSMLGYRIRRLATSSASDDSPLVSQTFLGLILFFYAMQISQSGFSISSIMTPDVDASISLGTFNDLIYTSPTQWFRWMAFALLHGGIIHIGFNIYALYILCPMIEAQIGRSRLLSLITLTQFGAALACFLYYFQYLGYTDMSVVGASGWIFGVMGYAIVRFHRNSDLHIRNSLLKWCMFSLIIGFFIPMISNTGHIGGLITGVIFGILPEGGNLRKLWVEKAWTITGQLSVVLWLITIVFMLYSFINGGTESILLNDIPDDF